MRRRFQNNIIDSGCKIYDPGVYIQRQDHKLYTPQEWDADWNDQVLGIAILTDRISFVIAPSQLNPRMIWSSSSEVEPTIFISEYYDTAKKDYWGRDNMDAYIERYGISDTSGAFGQCNLYQFADGRTGYIGGYGEWIAAYKSKNDVDSCLAIAGAQPMDTGFYHWTSTQTDKSTVYTLHWGTGAQPPGLKYDQFVVRPFVELILP